VPREQRRRREAREGGSDGDERSGQAVEGDAVGPLGRGGDPERQQPVGRRERDHDPVLRVGLRDQAADLHQADEAGRREQDQPALAQCDDGGGGEHECRERGAEVRELVRRVEQGGEGDGHRADQAHAGEDLGPPGDCRGRADRGDGGGDPERGQVGQQLVLGRGEQERRVAARDAGAGGRDCGVGVAVAPVRPDAGAEEQRRGDRAEGDTRRRADPPAVDRQHEEEDDAEHRDRGAGERQRPRAEPRREVELRLLEARRPRRPRRRQGRLVRRRRRDGDGGEAPWRRSLDGCGNVRRPGRRGRPGALRGRLGLVQRLEPFGHGPEPAELAPQGAELGFEGV
jgi:hypothetical protein